MFKSRSDDIRTIGGVVKRYFQIHSLCHWQWYDNPFGIWIVLTGIVRVAGKPVRSIEHTRFARHNKLVRFVEIFGAELLVDKSLLIHFC
ncbi:hypothetical protein D3C79_1039150 [compost metagenome]